MGVMACDRHGCENIMCDRSSTHYGYICDECFIELVHLRAIANVTAFMASDRNQDTAEADFAYFNALFQSGDD